MNVNFYSKCLVILTIIFLTACSEDSSNNNPVFKESNVVKMIYINRMEIIDSNFFIQLFLDVDGDKLEVTNIDVSNESTDGILYSFDNITQSFAISSSKVGNVDLLISLSDGHNVNQYIYHLRFISYESCELEFKGKNVVISYDDSPIEDFTKVLPYHQELGIPGEIGVWLDKLLEYSGNNEHIDIEQLKQLVDFGFEIMSHTTHHLPLSAGSTLSHYDENSTKIHTNLDTVLIRAVDYYNLSISTGNIFQFLDVDKIGWESNSSYLYLNEGLVKDFPSYSRVGLSENDIMFELFYSKFFLESYGLKIDHVAYPYGLSDELTIKKAIDADYITGRNALPNRAIGIVDSLYIDRIKDYFQIKSFDFSYLSESYIDNLFSQSSSDNQFLILFTHSWDENYTKEKLEYIVNSAKQHGFEFTTRSESLSVVCDI